MPCDPKTEFSVKEAAALIGMSGGGIRGAIRRGSMIADHDAEGRIRIYSHNLASYLVYGLPYPEEKMSAGQKKILHELLWTNYGGYVFDKNNV